MRYKYNFLVIGLGYVGINLYYNLCKKYKNVYGLDTSKKKVGELNNNFDSTYQIKNLKSVKKKIFSSIKNIKFDYVFICVPTGIKNNKPDLNNIQDAFKKAGKLIKNNGVVVNESTVYPGLTRELALKYIEKKNFLLNKNYYIAFSPERISPGDKISYKNIKRIIAASNSHSQKLVSKLYNSILNFKVFQASSIETAEAVKILENSQRDLNIAMINEYNEVFRKSKLNTMEIINLASSKWNFYKVFPGLVGGQCIPIDPYYALKYAKDFKSQLSLTKLGRETNENIKNKVQNKILKIAKERKKILFIGVAYKKNTFDYKYSKIYEIMKFINKRKFQINFFDTKIKKILINKKFIFSKKSNEIKKFNNIILGNALNGAQINNILKKVNKNSNIINLSSKIIKNKNYKIKLEPFA